MEYQEFLKKKQHSVIDYGIEPNFIPDFLFDFQQYVAEYAIKKGRCAVFLDTGLGKTIIELVIAQNYLNKFNKRVLIITPLAVAFQFIKEAEKFGINDIEYSKTGKFNSKIVVCNYERLEHFNPDDFNCVLLDESSILKNFDGAIKSHITAFMKKIPYRFLFTATPSPNDYIELGTSSEALGYLGYMDMLKKFFANNENNIRPQEIANKWYLKPHAKNDFFNWVSGWSISMRKPSDLGFSDERFKLPELILNYHKVLNEDNLLFQDQFVLWNKISRSMTEVRNEQKQTIEIRVNKAVELANNYDTSVYWCNFNDEGDLLQEIDKNAKQIKGSMDIDKKEELLLAFANGQIKKLITKPKITAFGLNWQHCNHTVYFPTWSYEQYYQSIRRFWRFGQTKNVIADLVYSDGQKRVLDALLLKSDKANELFTKLNTHLHQSYKPDIKEITNNFNLPNFLKVA